MRDCDLLLMLGTDFPYQQFFPESKDAQAVQVDILPENLGRRTRLSLGIVARRYLDVDTPAPTASVEDR